jgi:pimeloyl-ACP methyl ester carboxylesterase
MVLLHEVAGSGDRFCKIQPLLAERHRTLALDHIGYGDSDKPAAYPGIEGYAKAVVDFLDAMALDKVDLLGFHTGSGIAVEVAAAYPERIHRLMVCGLPDVREEDRAKKLAALHPTSVTPDGAYLDKLKQGLQSLYHFWGWDFAHAYGIDFLKAAPNDHWGHQAVFEMKVRERIPLVRAPTLLFCSANDAFVRFQSELGQLFQNVETAVIAESEKFPLVNQPEISRRLIESFLERH